MQKIRKIKEGWYNQILAKPLKGLENSNIQFIIEVNGTYGVASIKPITIKEIDDIDLRQYNFRPFKEVIKTSVI